MRRTKPSTLSAGALARTLGAGTALAMVLVGNAGAADRPLYLDPRAPLEARVSDLLGRLTLDEKIALMAGGSSFGTAPVPRLGIPSLHFSDGPNGVRSNEGRPTTVFPTGSALAATWNPDVIHAVGEAIGREALAMNVQVMLGPDVNIQRMPLAGRNFEDYSEDPYLAGEIGIAMVRGIQSEGVGTSVKHFVGNEQELERMRSSSNIDERTLREIYLRPFEMIVAEAHPWTLMASYNRLNGTYMTENRRVVHGVLEGEWGFDGVLMSDWGAVHTTVAAANSGLDLEMPGPPRYFGAPLQSAVRDWQVDQGAVEDAARRMVRTILRSGLLDGRPRSHGELLSARNRAAALAAAQESIVLLKNEHDALPLDRTRIHTLAVIGLNADVPLYEGGGSAHAIPSSTATPLMSLRRLAGNSIDIRYARGADNNAVPPPIDSRLLSPTAPAAGAGGDAGAERGADAEHGLVFRYFSNANFNGQPAETGIETDFDKVRIGDNLGQMSARWEGYLAAPASGTYQFSLSAAGDATLSIDGKRIIGPQEGSMLPPQIDFGAPMKLASVTLEAGHRYRLQVDYASSPNPFHSMHLGLRLPTPSIDEAVATARGADAAIVFVGSSSSAETEGRDRTSLALAGRQNDVVEAVLAANPRTIVVLQSGSAYELPWADRVPGIIEAWLDGVAGPDALAQVLFGEVNPSGKLPFTFPQRLADNPTYLYYPAQRDADYGEGVFVGYRWYDKRQIAPLFAFGHGLSYTTFAYANLRAPESVTVGQPIEVAVDVKNTGSRAGEETAELYVGDQATTTVVRPLKELKAFRKVKLEPGQTTTVRFKLEPRDLAFYDAQQDAWVSTPGPHRIYIGSSSRDIRAQKDFELAAERAAASGPEAVAR
ncbi:MAG TPA: glycoside hydrolase family 3 C-terminal domain-containing protein [Steroidobacteraceae bacterium]|nr:glycoside hydrolase family 3 C-terminal domain-containing protein [Steroidobacteraceae bacterium]